MPCCGTLQAPAAVRRRPDLALCAVVYPPCRYDPLRDGPLRYLGYANELGEAFAAWLFPGGVPLRWAQYWWLVGVGESLAVQVRTGASQPAAAADVQLASKLCRSAIAIF